MIKRLIFDLDDTLIIFNKNIYETIKPTLNELGIASSKNIIEQIKNSIRIYEDNYSFYSKKNIMQHINNYAMVKLSDEFIDVWLKYLGQVEPYNLEYNEETKRTLEYLRKKYELVVLTNWFTSSQIDRLKLAGLYDYFIEVLGTENILNKPNKEAFIKACGDFKINECIMIGDNITKDIEGATNIGMDTILCDYEDKHQSYQKTKIKKIIELKEML